MNSARTGGSPRTPISLETVLKLPFGIYRLYWKDGGSSLAAVGQRASGMRWFAPVNWLSVPSISWESVESIELLIPADR